MSDEHYFGIASLAILAMILIHLSVGHYMEHKKVIS